MLFISHSSNDNEITKKIAESLKEVGIETWADVINKIPNGRDWEEYLRSKIKEADAGIFVMSQASLKSKYCKSECRRFIKSEKPLYIVMIEPCHFDDIWLDIDDKQYSNLYHNYHDFQQGIKDIVTSINGQAEGNLPTAFFKSITGKYQMRSIPYFNNPFRGRDNDLDEVHKCLGKGGITQIVGTGGLGKSRLAAEVVLTFPLSTIWHRCSSTSQAHDLRILIRQHLNLAENISEDRLLSVLESQRAVIVIDNAEDVTSYHQPGYVEFIQVLASTGSPIMITSRREWHDLRDSVTYTPSSFPLETAVSITRDVAESKNYLLTDKQAQDLAKRARQYPRLIEFSVEQLKTLGFDFVIEQLTELKGYDDIEEVLEKILYKTIEQMVIEAGELPRTLLYHLPRLLSSFPLEAIQAIAPEKLSDKRILDRTIKVLINWQFLRHTPSSGRYKLAELVREVLPIPDDEELFTIYAYFYINQADSIFKLPLEQWKQHNDDIENIIAIGDFISLKKTNLDENHMELSVIFTDYSSNYIIWRAEENKYYWLETALRSVRSLKSIKSENLQLLSSLEARFLYYMGHLLSFSNKPQALDKLNEALILFRAIDDKTTEAFTLNIIGNILHKLGDIPGAIKCYNQAIPIASNPLKIVLLNNIGSIWSTIGEKQQALLIYTQVLMLKKKTRHTENEGVTLNNIGKILIEIGKPKQGLRILLKALPLRKSIEDKYGEAETLNNIGIAYKELKNKTKALYFCKQALSIFEKIDYKLGQITILYNIGEIHNDNKNKKYTLEYYKKALSLSEEIIDKSNAAIISYNIGLVYYKMDDLGQAIIYIERCIELEEAINHPDLEQDRKFLQQLKAERNFNP